MLNSKETVEEEKLMVKDGILYCDGKCVGESQERRGFSQYYFDEEPLGSGANGVTFRVTHKILNVKQVIKIYFPKEDEVRVSLKAKEEARKNANTLLAGVTAVIFDAGEYNYPCKLWYSIMESVSSYCTIKQWRANREKYFPSNKNKFDIESEKCRSSIRASLNLAAGFLKAVITLYENDVIHGDLNPGNVLWIFDTDTVDEEMKRVSSYYYSVLGELEPFCVRLIDMGASKASDIKEAGMIRDSWKLYEHMKSFLSPIFIDQEIRFADWFKFELLETNKCQMFGVERIICVRENEKVSWIKPQEIAGDLFRLISVLMLAFGIITNASTEKEKSINLEIIDKNDFYVLMFEKNIRGAIEAFSFDSMLVLNKLSKMSSCGEWINWENVWSSYPFNRINISPVLNAKKENDMYC
ncbi:MAG: hypothetical protein K2K10_06920 [Acetatifactor sp.]|nr:hypothetical protein [Acetatifactor sp.]